MKRSHRRKWIFQYCHNTKHGKLWYYGKHRWGRRPSKGRYYHYNKFLKGFYPNQKQKKESPKEYAYRKTQGMTGLAGLKAFWSAYRYKKYGLR